MNFLLEVVELILEPSDQVNLLLGPGLLIVGGVFELCGGWLGPLDAAVVLVILLAFPIVLFLFKLRLDLAEHGEGVS